ncbi:TetR/AcrR family transcriptional regulator [Nocardia zapadnayensis]|uniref:TetR/AcrR family transcriptional regulator n=1 Tax=Nocardia rhamnosiphila TaxID=426716 RepID=UPI0022482534|nr:helix-turn-helix domain-containing protein [Nocardia zapadnayensis]MCX0274198.1 TetR/AcrR family transcriptional regulator [Nocardia zapadnayensis]
MARARGAVQLTVDDWLQAGYTVLAEEGFRALKLDEICRRLGVTKGSFYHHFSDITAFKDALVAAWGGRRDQDHQRMDALAGVAPRERLIETMGLLTGSCGRRRSSRSSGSGRSPRSRPGRRRIR